MSNDPDDKNPLEELQKQFAELFGKGSTVTLPFQFDEGPTKKDKNAEDQQKAKDEETLRRIQAFNLKPKEIRDYLDRFVIKQNEPKKVLSVAMCDHYNHVRACLKDPSLLSKDYSKQNILLLGSTGVGKTYLMRTIAKLIGVPFIKADATKFSETGYVGGDVEDVVRDLVKAANGNIELAQYGIIYIDEIDKIASETASNGRDISGRGVQINLLKLMEDTEVNVLGSNDIMGQMRSVFNLGGKPPKKQRPTINTRHILFIVSGAFDKLADSIKRRLNHNAIGFASTSSLENNPSNYLQKANTGDFIAYGFEPEFIGRLPIRVACEPLKEEDLAQILLSSEGSILKQYKEDFRGYGIDCTVELDAIQEIAKRAAVEQTGARGLMTILEHTFRPFKFELPSSSIRTFTVTAQTVIDPEAALHTLLQANSSDTLDLEEDLQRFIEAFEIENGLKLDFERQAIEALLSLATKQKKGVRLVCEDLFKNFPHGLKLIARNSQKKVFTISAEVVENPEKELSQWIIHSFNESLNYASSASHS